MKRDLFIDVSKGIATLSIIFIHTVFWSGQYYVPSELRNLSLLVDVPVFFFLSGFTSSGKIEKNIHRLLKLQITYMLYITLVFIIYCIFNRSFSLNRLWDWYFYTYSDSKPVEVAISSMWYMKIYFLVIFTGVVVLHYLSKKQINIVVCFLSLGIIYFSFYLYPTGNTGYIFVYLLIFLIAHQCKNLRLKPLYFAISILLLLMIYFLLYLYFGDKATVLVRRQKFPPTLVYLIYSSFSLVILLFLKGRIHFTKNNIFSYIGQNAIFFYFAQGLSSSLIYILVNAWKDEIAWPVLLVIIFSINIGLATIIAHILKKIDSWGWKSFRFIRNKTM